MSKKTKAELLIELENMTEEKDILFDDLENAQTEISDLEDEISNLREKEDTLDILMNYLNQYRIAHTRYDMGILSELETIEKLTEKLLDISQEENK